MYLFVALMFLFSFKTSETGCCSELFICKNLALCRWNRISHSRVSDRNPERSFLSLVWSPAGAEKMDPNASDRRKSSGRVLMWSRQYQDQASKEGTSGTMNEQEQDLWNTAGVLTVSLHAHIRRATVIDLQSQTNTKVWLFLTSCKRTEWLMKTLDWTSSRSSSDRTPPTSSALNESSISSLTLRWSLSSPLTSSPLLWRPGVRRQNCSTLPLT